MSAIPDTSCPSCGQALPAGSGSCWACDQPAPGPPSPFLQLALIAVVIAGGIGGLAAWAILGTSTPSVAEHAPAIAGTSQIPGASTTVFVRPSNPPGEWVVQPGDTLVTIASALGVTREQLRWWNLSRYASLETNPMAINVGWSLVAQGEPMPVPSPRPSPEPRSTPQLAPTAAPRARSDGGAPAPAPPPPIGGGRVPAAPAPPAASDWTAAMEVRAAAYKGDARATYDQAVRTANYEIAIAGFTSPGATPEERAARIAGAKMMAAYNLMLAIQAHFNFMNFNPPAACFIDAYHADVDAGSALVASAQAMMDSQGVGDLSSGLPGRDAFLAGLDSYFSDCQ